MAKLKTLKVQRFKRLERVDVELHDVTVLLGANNSGKSSILQALHFAVSVAQSARLVGEGVTWQKDRFQLSFNPSQLIYSPVADVMTIASGGILQERSNARVEIVLVTAEDEQCVVGLQRGRNRNIAISIEGRSLGERLMDIEHPFTVYAPGLAGIPKQEQYLSPGVVRRAVARGDANLVLRNVLRMLQKDTPSWLAFLEDMRSIFPDIHIHIDFDDNTDENISAHFSTAGGPTLPVDAAGTSILQASQLLAYISLFKPQVLILDEPDSHLHPDNQRALCDVVARVAGERAIQVLVSTHSRHVLDAMKNRAAVVWLSKGSIVAEKDISTTAMLLDLGALDSVDYFSNQALKCVVATEDTDKEPLRALLWSNGFSKSETEVASYSGCSKVDAALVLGQFLSDKATRIRLVIHRDSDYQSLEQGEIFRHKLQACAIDTFLTALNDIECYFLKADHLAYLNPGLSVERAQGIIDQATADSASDSIKAIVNLRTEHAFLERRRTNVAPDHGSIAVDAIRDYESAPDAMRRGKVVIGKVSAAIQQELGRNARIYAQSPHLNVLALKQIAQGLWPAQAK